MQSSFLPICLTSLLLFPVSVLAQIIPDRTLGPESSVVYPDQTKGTEVDRISGGAMRGSNLFHSFSEFNINQGRGAYFANPDQISNIFTRVTGNNASKIFGTLGVLGNANLFLLNPQGVIFGPQARLDLRGSFLATTADSIVFDQGWEFSASQPETPLLNINMPLGLNFRNPGNIVNQSQSSRLVNDQETTVGLEVSSGQTLGLIGGNINLDSGNLTAEQGNIFLVSIASQGFVGLQFTPSPSPALQSKLGLNFSNIELSGTSRINTSGFGSGSIDLQANQITLRDSARLISGTIGNTKGGDITINARQVRLLDKSAIETSTINGIARGGNINITATELVELSGAGYEKFLQEWIVEPVGGQFKLSNPESSVSSFSVAGGATGDITINAPKLDIINGSMIGTLPVFTSAKGGNVRLNAQDLQVLSSGVYAPAPTQGDGGNIEINTARLTVSDGGLVITNSLGSGNAGNITINASDWIISSALRSNKLVQQTFSTSTFIGAGNAGNIEINTGSLTLKEGAVINSTNNVFFRDRVLTSTGKSGNITINARDSVIIEGLNLELADKFSPTGLSTSTTNSTPAGNLMINTQRLILRDSGIISATTNSNGKGGNLIINASELIELSGQSFGEIRNTITTSAALNIQTAVTPQGTPLPSTPNNDAIIPVAPVSVLPSSNSPLPDNLNSSTPSGDAGNLTINTARLNVENGRLTAVNFGTGKAGNINLFAREIFLNNDSPISARTDIGGGGNINIESRQIILKNSSRITTDSRATSEGGNININSDILLAFPNNNTDISANARSARGGIVTLNVPNIFGLEAISRPEAQQQLNLTDAEFTQLETTPTLLLPSNDISAISQQAGANLQGNIIFSTSGINPVYGLLELPKNVTDPNALIAGNICNLSKNSQFIITGKGGIAANPTDLFTGQSVQFTWLQPVAITDQQLSINNDYLPTKSIVPATGWVMSDRGEVRLISAVVNTVNGYRFDRVWGNCQPH